MKITFDDFCKKATEDAKKELIDFIKSLKELSLEEVREVKKYLSNKEEKHEINGYPKKENRR